MKSVSHIFGGEGKVKIMRLFVFNPEVPYDAPSVSDRIKENISTVRKELARLSKAGLIKKKMYTKQIPPKRRGGKPSARRVQGYMLNPTYRYIEPLRHFLIDAAPITEREIIKKISKAGSIKVLCTSGVFLHDPEARVDLLVVGDHIKQPALISAISSIEAELGKELRYAAFETSDFQYRLGLYDKLVRDIIDFPHQKLVNKLGI